MARACQNQRRRSGGAASPKSATGFNRTIRKYRRAPRRRSSDRAFHFGVHPGFPLIRGGPPLSPLAMSLPGGAALSNASGGLRAALLAMPGLAQHGLATSTFP